MKVLPVLALLLTLAAPAANAVPFGGWSEQKFSRLPANDWRQSRTGVDVASDKSVSLIWTRLGASEGSARSASWDWSVSESVPGTQLTQKGGDDRNLSLYFVFLPPDRAEASRDASIRKMLRARDARVIMYVWGGTNSRNTVVPSPYLGARGKTIVLRPAGTGSFRERVDLEADFRRAFGEVKPVLVGLAVSADSDDTETSVRARLGNLRLE